MTRKNLIGFFIVLIWLAIGVLLTMQRIKEARSERENWSDDQWREYYEANEKRSFRGE